MNAQTRLHGGTSLYGDSDENDTNYNYFNDIKAKAVPLHTTTVGGEEVQLLLIHDLGTRWG
jgi:hypothetical protein